MNKNRMPLTNEEPKYRKKSQSKGQPRSKHKHIYETVLLIRDYHTTDYETGKPKVSQIILPTKVCTICGRIAETDEDPSLYVKELIPDLPFIVYKKVLSEKALNLPKWHSEYFRDKFAVKMDN